MEVGCEEGVCVGGKDEVSRFWSGVGDCLDEWFVGVVGEERAGPNWFLWSCKKAVTARARVGFWYGSVRGVAGWESLSVIGVVSISDPQLISWGSISGAVGGFCEGDWGRG